MVTLGHNIKLLTLKEAATFSPYSADYLNLLARKGKLKAEKIGRDWLVKKTDLLEYLKKQHTESKVRAGELSRYLSMLV